MTDVDAESSRARRPSRRSFLLGCLALPVAAVAGAGRRSLDSGEEDFSKEWPGDPRHAADSRLVPAHRLEGFVVGPHNQFAYAAATAAADHALRPAFNPVFIFGPGGTGKTHLLHGIGNRARFLQPRLRVRYRTGQQLAWEFIDTVRDDRSAQFRQPYETVDLLLIDDLHGLHRLERTQEEFIWIFDAVWRMGRQIVIASDRPPRHLQMIDHRIANRCLRGPVAEISRPSDQPAGVT